MALRAGVLAIIGGILLLAAGATGSTLLFDQVGAFVEDRFASSAGVVETVLQVLAYLAALGGLVVIVGGALMFIGKEGVGRFVTVLAAFMALVGFILQIIVVIDQGEGRGSYGMDVALVIAGIGIVLAFWDRP